ncbi:MAG: DNA methyltransferase, partial [Pseudomonadota bacterium]
GRSQPGINMSKKTYKYWKPKLELETTTLWEYPSQHYGEEHQGDPDYIGATPSYIIWNLLQRYTQEGDRVLDPMCGSGTTLDVCKDLGREGLGFDLQSKRPEIRENDARKLPLAANSIDFCFLDPPYSTHVQYSGKPECVGELSAAGPEYYTALEQVISEIARVLKPGKYMGLYVSDSFQKGKPFMPIGFELFAIMRKHFEAQDIITVTRHNRSLKRFNWHKAAIEGNYFLRGFNYLFIMRKPGGRHHLSTGSSKTSSAGTGSSVDVSSVTSKMGSHEGHTTGRENSGKRLKGRAKKRAIEKSVYQRRKTRDDGKSGLERDGKGKKD